VRRDQLAQLAGIAAATGQEARLIAARRRMQAVRLTDDDRDLCASYLSEQYSVGRLNREELEDRLDLLHQAHVHADLTPVFDGLPVPLALYGLDRRRAPRWPWVVGGLAASLALPFFTIGLILLALGKEVAAAFFLGPAAVWIFLSLRWARRRTRRSLPPAH
jgi:hypothetical protein